MSITTDRIAKANGIGGKANSLDAVANSYLFEALSGALDSLTTGVVIVTDQGKILHANQAAQEMLDAKSPIISLGGCLCALQTERTKELRCVIAAAQADQDAIGLAGVGVPLIDKTGAAATAHVLPLASSHRRPARSSAQIPVAVFVMSANVAPSVEIATVARSFNLTPAEARLLHHLVCGVSLHEAAAALGVAEATARTHRNHIFIKTGVCRRTELLLLVGRLVPPIRRPPLTLSRTVYSVWLSPHGRCQRARKTVASGERPRR
jgi:DNA-binding CsgD family transcriptional regulator